jgi:plastocyanin
MGVRSRLGAAVLAGAALALVAAAAQAEDRTVEADGNPFSGGLQFDPPKVKVNVGDNVTWTNTDPTVPHTATEDHGLWDLTGTYGLPGNQGFGPGESRTRQFEAGTQHYFCKVHPAQMRGVVRVPVRANVRKFNAFGTRRLTIRWAPRPSKGDRVFDVQLKLDGGSPWRKFRTGTHEAIGTRNNSGPKLGYSIRARMRSKSHPAKATGWSPVVHVKL